MTDDTFFRRPETLLVESVALVAVVATPFPLYAVLVLYAVDAVVGTVRLYAQVVFAAPRGEFSPTEPPSFTARGTPGPFRFLLPKVGTVRVSRRLPPVSLHNASSLGTLGLSLVLLVAIPFGAAAAILGPTAGFAAFAAWPTPGVLAAGAVAAVAKHGLAARRVFAGGRPTAATVSPGSTLGSVLPAVPALLFVPTYAVNYLHSYGPEASEAVATLGAPVAVVLILGRAAYGLRASTRPEAASAEPVSLPEPAGAPVEQFRPSRRAVRTAGLLDGLVGYVGWEPETVDEYAAPWWVRWLRGLSMRAVAVVAAAVVGVSVAYAAGYVPISVGSSVFLAAVVAPPLVVGLVFATVGVLHFELAFGAMEYRLYDDELVAYDERLDAVQWRVPLDAITGVSVDRGRTASPPGTAAGAVVLDRTDEQAVEPPYYFYRRTLPYLAAPDRVAERLGLAADRG